MEPLILPSGYGFRPLSAQDLRAAGTVLESCAIWEAPRRRGPRRYVMGVDVSDGMGLDRSVIEVIRVGTILEPAEQVAEYISDQVSPAALAYVAQALGEYYRDEDGVEAMACIECNNAGLATQNMLQLHLGYGHFYIWEYYDAADPSRRQSTKIGWWTTPRTRPLLLNRLRADLTTLDAVTNQPDLITHSPILHQELRDFQTDGALWEAAAAKGAHDDTVMALAIGNYCAWVQQSGEQEPVEDRRRRRSEQEAILAAASAERIKPDWRNTPATSDDLERWEAFGDQLPDEVVAALYDGAP